MDMLKPCPFCGGNDIEFFHNEYTGDRINATPWMANCNDCSVSLESFPTKEQAISTWNRRANEVTP